MGVGLESKSLEYLQRKNNKGKPLQLDLVVDVVPHCSWSLTIVLTIVRCPQTLGGQHMMPTLVDCITKAQRMRNPLFSLCSGGLVAVGW